MPKKNKLPQDEYSIYEECLFLLGSLLDKYSPEYNKFVVYHYRLLDSISKSRLYGDCPQNKSDRYEVLNHLNILALLTQDTPFLSKPLLKKTLRNFL